MADACELSIDHQHVAVLRKLTPIAKQELMSLHTGADSSARMAEPLDSMQRGQLLKAVTSCSEMCVAATMSPDHLRVAAENKETVRRAFIHVILVELLEHYRDPKTGCVVDFSKLDAPAGRSRDSPASGRYRRPEDTQERCFLPCLSVCLFP